LIPGRGRNLLFVTMSRLILRPTQPPIQWVLLAISSGLKQPSHEADCSPPSGAEIHHAWRYTSTPPYVFMVWCLIKHRVNFTCIFTFTLLDNLSLILLSVETLWSVIIHDAYALLTNQLTQPTDRPTDRPTNQ